MALKSFLYLLLRNFSLHKGLSLCSFSFQQLWPYRTATWVFYFSTKTDHSLCMLDYRRVCVNK